MIDKFFDWLSTVLDKIETFAVNKAIPRVIRAFAMGLLSIAFASGMCALILGLAFGIFLSAEWLVRYAPLVVLGVVAGFTIMAIGYSVTGEDTVMEAPRYPDGDDDGF